MKVLIASVNRKHVNHADLIKQLSGQGYEIKETALPDENSGTCSVEKDIERDVQGLDLIIIYISSELSKNVCIESMTRLAEKDGVRIVSIWLDDTKAGAIPQSADSFSDSVTTYKGDLSKVFSGEENPWQLPDGSTPAKRKINKHTCG